MSKLMSVFGVLGTAILTSPLTCLGLFGWVLWLGIVGKAVDVARQ